VQRSKETAMGLLRRTSTATDGLAIRKVASRRKGARMSVESASFAADGSIPDTFSEYGKRQSPPLRWSGAPKETASLAVIVEDPDAPAPEPFSHWVLFNLPPEITELPASVPADVRLPDLGNAAQGRSSAGPVGYFGPRPPQGSGVHHYHFEVFALDRKLDVEPGADRDAVVDAMRGHVLASGEVIGTYQA
jgi:Raf kinase inhibitor-like YbhB/YbcL family protein